MIRRWNEVTCDYCFSAIGHYPGSKKDAWKYAKQEGAITYKEFIFCDANCFEQWKRNGMQDFLKG